jgi:hypothetical protein
VEGLASFRDAITEMREVPVLRPLIQDQRKVISAKLLQVRRNIAATVLGIHNPG